MITRLIPKPTHRLLAIQYNGENEKEIIEFCDKCHISHKVLYFGTEFVVIGDWIVKYTDEEFGIITNDVRTALYK